MLQRYYVRVCPLDRSFDPLDDGCIGIVVDGVPNENVAPEEKAEPVVKAEPVEETALELEAVLEKKAALKVKAEPEEESAPDLKAIPEEKAAPKVKVEPEEEAAPGEKAASRLRRELGAMEMVHTGQTITFTMPVGANDQSKYFKLDVHVSPPGLFTWQKTAFNHLRMWLILCEYFEYLGFSSHDSGLYLNLHEKETGPCRSPGCRLHLTSDPSLMMLLFDLDPIRFAAGFKSLDELFAWATRSEVLAWRNGDLIPGRPHVEMPIRKAFRLQWLPEHCPLLCVRLRYQDFQIARSALREKALMLFHKGDAYKEAKLNRPRKPATLWTHIAGSLPLAEPERYRAMLALTALLQWEDGYIVLRPKRHVDEGVPRFEEHGVAGSRYVNTFVVPWVRQNWLNAIRLHDALQAQRFHDLWRGVLVVR